MRRPAFVLLAALATTGCFPDWDLLDPSNGMAATGGTGGAISEGGGGTGAMGGSTSSNGGTGGTGGGEGGMAPLGPWSTPQVVPALSHPEDDDDPTMTADGLEVYFNSLRSGNPDIWVSTRPSRDDPWGAPTLVDELNSPFNDGNHTVSPDGLTMWIDSNRDDTTSSDIYYVATRPSRSATWGTPVPADDVNAAGVGDVAGVTWDGLLMVGNVSVSGALSEMAQLVRASTSQNWGAAIPLDELNSPVGDSEGWLHPDGTHVAFASNRPGGLGSADIYVSSRATVMDPFELPVDELELSSVSDESDITMSEDRRHVLFARPVGAGGEREIFEASR